MAMFLDKKPFIFLWRPFYRLVFERIIHPIVRRFWASVLLQPLPPHPPANSMAAHLQETKRILETMGRLETALAQSKQEWLATEKLLIALMQEPGSQYAPAPEPLHRAESSNQAG